MNNIKCKNCDSLREGTGTGYYCVVTFGNIDSISEHPHWCPRLRNCHEYCPLSNMCKYAKGEKGQDPFECAAYYKLDDLRNDAMDIEEEERRSAGMEEDEWEE